MNRLSSRGNLRALGALASGALLGASFQPIGWWPLAPLAIAALTWLLRGRSPGQGFGLGWIFGLGLGWVAISWVDVLGAWIAVILVAFMALWQGMFGWGAALLTRPGRSPWWLLLVPGLWSLAEYGASRVPFGGFGWLRLAYPMVDSPLAGSLPWIGVGGLSFLVALIGVAIGALLPPPSRPARPQVPAVVLATSAVVGIVAATIARPVELPSTGESVDVGMVQGDVTGTAGSEAMGYARSVTDNHVSETVELMARARAGLDPMPDFVLWPENSTDIDPTHDAQTANLIMEASRTTGLPIFVGAVMRGPGEGERQTSGLWWGTDGRISARYDKRNLVPFGEWIPLREQLLPVLPILEQVGAQSVPGTRPGVIDATLGDGRIIRLGDIICFELAWDRTVREAMTDAQLVVVQSNNATYTGTGQPWQQFAVTRSRAMESGREIVVSTTSSLSGLVHADGSVTGRTDEATSAAQTFTVPLRAGATPGPRVGPWVEGAAALVSGVGVLVALVLGRIRRHATDPREPLPGSSSGGAISASRV